MCMCVRMCVYEWMCIKGAASVYAASMQMCAWVHMQHKYYYLHLTFVFMCVQCLCKGLCVLIKWCKDFFHVWKCHICRSLSPCVSRSLSVWLGFCTRHSLWGIHFYHVRSLSRCDCVREALYMHCMCVNRWYIQIGVCLCVCEFMCVSACVFLSAHVQSPPARTIITARAHSRQPSPRGPWLRPAWRDAAWLTVEPGFMPPPPNSQTHIETRGKKMNAEIHRCIQTKCDILAEQD